MNKKHGLYGFSCEMASASAREEADWLRLFLFENKVKNITKRAT